MKDDDDGNEQEGILQFPKEQVISKSFTKHLGNT